MIDTPAPSCQPNTETLRHTPTPWNCASRYSSVVGVPIVNQQGKRIGNTALPDMPPEWEHMKRQAEVDAAFICEAVNSHAALSSRIAELESNERAYEAALGQRTYNEVAEHIAELEKALRKAIKHLDDIEQFACNPDRPCGEYGAECPISMGEWFRKDDRDELAAIRAALTSPSEVTRG